MTDGSSWQAGDEGGRFKVTNALSEAGQILSWPNPSCGLGGSRRLKDATACLTTLPASSNILANHGTDAESSKHSSECVDVHRAQQ